MLAVKSMDKMLHLNQNRFESHRPNKQSLNQLLLSLSYRSIKRMDKNSKTSTKDCKLKRGKQFSAGTIVNINVNIITCPASQMLFHVYYETGNYSKQAHHYAKNYYRIFEENEFKKE